MKNSDLPAMPIGEQIDICHFNATCNGLTKREHFAGLVMQGRMAAFHARPSNETIRSMAVDSKIAADALLAELDKVQK